MLTLTKISARQMEEAGYCGPCGGAITGAHYALYEDGKGFCSLDGGRTVFTLKGPYGKKSMQKIIDDGGLVGEIDYMSHL